MSTSKTKKPSKPRKKVAVVQDEKEDEAVSLYEYKKTQDKAKEADVLAWKRYQENWCLFAREVMGVYIDEEQEAILKSVQNNRRTVVRSGHARGKDFITAVAALCFFFLRGPCKVILTAPTGRQAIAIMMAEVGKLFRKIENKLKEFGYDMGCELLNDRIKTKDTSWYLMAFKADDDETESWTGFHSARIFIAVTEASGISDKVFDALEGLLTGFSRYLQVGNPHKLIGEFYRAFTSPLYHGFTLNCMKAPNVISKEVKIPGQVDWNWVDDHVHKAGWCTEIDKADMREDKFDFEWEGRYYRPSDIFRIKVLGQFPEEMEGTLIPNSWLLLANKRWQELRKTPNLLAQELAKPLRLGADVAGQGKAMTIYTMRRGNWVPEFKPKSRQDHMKTAGEIKNMLQKPGDFALVDTIGEGAGVYSRLKEMHTSANPIRVISAKFSETAEGLHDVTGERTFARMRDYCYWALRDALDPSLNGQLALPPCKELEEELRETTWDTTSDGKVKIRSKKDIIDAIRRSPDYSDSLALSFFPVFRRVAYVVHGNYDCIPVEGV